MWRSGFAVLVGLVDRKRNGRPPSSFTPLQAAPAFACQLPAETGPLDHPELARESVKRGIAPFLSASTVRR
ncbi:hypothetical protein [Streptomyces sp. NBC_00467]|uniref:hypothetical protein n=1 Tax=Streptomyces sp. NBC_00467 TaxID=2975752 RepID=UPI002E1850C5